MFDWSALNDPILDTFGEHIMHLESGTIFEVVPDLTQRPDPQSRSDLQFADTQSYAFLTRSDYVPASLSRNDHLVTANFVFEVAALRSDRFGFSEIIAELADWSMVPALITENVLQILTEEDCPILI